jgi:hypothetical protein
MMWVKQVKFFLGGGAMATGWQWFGSKGERDLVRRGRQNTESTKFALGIGESENWNVLDGSDECPKVFLASSASCATESLGTGLRCEIRDKNAIGQLISAESEAKSVTSALNADGDVGLVEERTGTETKRGDRDGGRLRRKRFSILNSLEVLYIRRNVDMR